MFLHIDDRMKIEDVQERFNDCFPFLRIAFYSKRHKFHQPSENLDLLDSSEWIANVRKRHNNGVLEIKSWFTVARVESDLRHFFDLNAQIFRCNPDGEWVQASLCDTLSPQQLTAVA